MMSSPLSTLLFSSLQPSNFVKFPPPLFSALSSINMDSLRAMFPDLDTSTLQATLAAHDSSVERTVDYLLASRGGSGGTPRSASSADRQRQVDQDAALARRLQAEQDIALQRGAPVPAPAGGAGSTAPFNLPSLGDVQNAVKPIVDGVSYAGRVAAESVSSLYREFVGDGQPSTNPYHRVRDERDDDTVVLRGEATSPGGSRSTRMRRGVAGAASMGGAGKKDS